MERWKNFFRHYLQRVILRQLPQLILFALDNLADRERPHARVNLEECKTIALYLVTHGNQERSTVLTKVKLRAVVARVVYRILSRNESNVALSFSSCHFHGPLT